MTDSTAFLSRVLAARKAAWLVLLIGIGLQLLTYLAYIALDAGQLDGLIESGIFGDMSRDELASFTFVYAAAMKLINFVIFMGALFLTLWARGLRRIG